jgi:hypothetical protein
MKISISLLAKKLEVPLFILLFLLVISASSFGDNEEKKNGITGYFGSYIFLGEYADNSLSFNIEYEGKLDNRVSLAVSVGYLPLRWTEMSDDAYLTFCRKINDPLNFTQVSNPGLCLVLDFGFYVYFPFSNKRYSLFLYLGNSYYWWRESHKAFDNESPLTESLSTSESYYSLLDAGFGFKYRCSERYFLRAEWRTKDLKYLFMGGKPPIYSLLLGLSYRF